MGDYDARARAYLREVLLRLPDRGHAVVEEEHLSAAGDLRLYRGAHDIGQVAHDLRLDRDALARRRADEREVARPRHRQVQRPWNRRRRERQHVGGRAEPLQELLVPHAEALLFVDDYEPEVAERDLRREYRVRSDDDVAGTGRKPLECPLVRRRGLEARDGLDSYGRPVEARGEGLEVLFRKDRGRRENSRLPAVHRCYEGGPHRDFRLAVARVAADEAVHRLLRREIFLDGGYRGGLVGRLLVWERGLERVYSVALHIVGESRHELAPRLRLEERRGEVGDRLLRIGLVLRPALAVEPVQPDRLALYADIAREEMCVGCRHM